MRIPHIIYDNTIKAYEVPSIYLRNTILKGDVFTWDENIPKSLREQSLIVIAENWQRNPIYDALCIPADKLLLLELLATDLPLELTVPIIDEDYYWKKCYQARWPADPEPNRRFQFAKPGTYLTVSNNEYDENSDTEKKSMDVNSENIFSYMSDPSFAGVFGKRTFSRGGFSSTGYSQTKSQGKSNFSRVIIEMPSEPSRTSVATKLKKPGKTVIIELSWKQTFLQRFVAEEIERMKPDMFNPEYIKELTTLYGSYLICLNIRELQPSRKQDGCNHVSLHSLLANLPKLIKFTVCFKQLNLVGNFTWHSTELSDSDCELLGNGVEKSCIRILRVIRSNIDCDKVKLLVRPLSSHKFLHTLDLSHCKIGDEGAKAIAGMLMTNMVLEKLVLTNNRIGPEGTRGLCYYLCQDTSNISELDLKLNPLETEGGKYISTALCRGALNLTSLNISCCGLTAGNVQLGLSLGMNTTLQKFDISNNHLGEECAANILNAMQKNTTIIHFDLRMCGLSPESEQAIQTKVRKNLEAYRSIFLVPPSAEDIL